MVENQEKVREYAREYPKQLYVNQRNILSIQEYDVEDVAYAFIERLSQVVSHNSGSYTFHQEYLSSYVEVLHNYYESEIEKIDNNVQQEVNEVVEIAMEEEDEFVALLLAMPFIDVVSESNMLLDKLSDNIFDEDIVELLHRDDRQLIGGRVVPK